MIDRREHLRAWRCGNGHVNLHASDRCPVCQGRTLPTRVRAYGQLVTCTTVRVNSTGEPYRLGVARTRQGASTLCVVEGNVRNNGLDWVRLEWRGDHYVARGVGTRTTDRNRARVSTPADSQKS